MTKDEFIFELIDQCIYFACLDNIIVENLQLLDDVGFYKSVEEQFLSCIKFYTQMDDLRCKHKISEQKMDEELRDVIALIRSEILKDLYNDLVKFLNNSRLPEKERNAQIQRLSLNMSSNILDTKWLLNTIQEFRELEQKCPV